MAARCTFIFNPVLVSMVINDDNVEIKFKKYKKVFELNKIGLSNIQISSLLSMTTGNVSRDLWGYKKGRYKI